MLKSYILFYVLLGASCCFAASIDAPKTSPENQLVRATTRETGEGYVWLVAGASSGFVDSQDYPIIENDKTVGSGCVFTGPKGQYAIILLIFKENKTVSRAQHFTTIGGSGPAPPPDNPPNPPDNPPTPPDKPDPATPLAKQMIKWLESMKGKISKDELNKMADVYEGIAAQAVAVQETWPIAAFKSRTQDQLLQFLSEEQALGLSKEFAPRFADYLYAKKISSNDEAALAAAWREMADGLREVSKVW